MECVEIINLMLFICTGLLFLFGAALVGICVYAILEYSSLMTLIASSTVGDVSLVVIIFGCILLAAGGLGMFASCRRDRLVLLVFAGLLAFIILAELGLGIAALVLGGDIKAGAADGMQKTMKGYLYKDNLKVAWDETQTQLKCCGSANYSAWGHYIYTESGEPDIDPLKTTNSITSLPASCTTDEVLLSKAKTCLVESEEHHLWKAENGERQAELNKKPSSERTPEEDEFMDTKPTSADPSPSGAQCVEVDNLPIRKETDQKEDASKIYGQGCGRLIVTSLLSAMTMIGGILIAVGCLQVLNVFCAVYVAKKIQDDNKKEIEEEEKLKKSENNDKNEGYTPKWKK